MHRHPRGTENGSRTRKRVLPHTFARRQPPNKLILPRKNASPRRIFPGTTRRTEFCPASSVAPAVSGKQEGDTGTKIRGDCLPTGAGPNLLGEVLPRDDIRAIKSGDRTTGLCAEAIAKRAANAMAGKPVHMGEQYAGNGHEPKVVGTAVTTWHIKQLRKPIREPEAVSFRRGPGGIDLAYLEHAEVYRRANFIFGNHGWSTSINKCQIIESLQVKNIWKCTATAIVVVRWKGSGTSHEDVGTGCGTNRNKSDAIGFALKSAVTDATKRALSKFGSALGNDLYFSGVAKHLQEEKRNLESRPARGRGSYS